MSLEGAESKGHTLAAFTVELDVYSGPYEGLLALILKDELEIFEVPLRELVALYRSAYSPHEQPEETSGALERDTDFVDSATSLILLKGRALDPALGTEEDEEDEELSPQDLEERLVTYLKVRRGAEALMQRFAENTGFYPSGHALRPRPGRLRLSDEKLAAATRRAFVRTAEPAVLGMVMVHFGPSPRPATSGRSP